MNEKTKRLLDSYIRRPHSSLLLVGSMASGAELCVDYLVGHLLSGESSNNIIKLYPEDDKSLTIEQVRDFKRSVITSSRSREKVSRIAFIYGVETASGDAQNALLKVLEEPVEQTVIVLIANDRKKVLPTIVSRCQIVPILPISEEQALDIAKSKNIDDAQARKFYMLSSGESTLYMQMLETVESNSVEHLQAAKTFLQMSPFERLQQQKMYDKNASLEKLLDELKLLATLGMHNASNQANTEKWHKMIKELREIDNLLKRNVLVKALFIRLCISL